MEEFTECHTCNAASVHREAAQPGENKEMPAHKHPQNPWLPTQDSGQLEADR